MASQAFDLIVLGAGPVGCALALGLARHAPDPGRIALLGPRPARRAPGAVIDPRAIALNHGSRRFLESLGVWPGHAADIRHVHVSQAGHFGQTHIDHHDLGVPRLGSVVAYDALLDALHTALEDSGVQHFPEHPPRPLAGRPVRVDLAHATLLGRLALVCDGSRPQGLHREYHQTAVLATVHATRPQLGWAYERFTPSGPLALLPHPAAADVYSLVWCVEPLRAQALLALPPEAFDAALQTAFGTRLGKLQHRGPTHTFPLSLHVGQQRLGPSVLAVGNAAQTLHPVAGQGLNLCLRDVAQLVHLLTPWLADPEAPFEALLQQYVRQRRLDRGLTIAITDTLPRLFTSRWPLVRPLCGLGLMALDLAAGLRRPLARHLMLGQRS